MTVHAPMTSTPAHGARLVTTEGKALPLEGASLRVDARAGLARVVLEQRFKNPHREPLTVTYRMPLPADAAVSGFAFRIGDRRIVGEIDKKRLARERYEEAILDGRSAALLEEETASLFTQEMGNIPPGQEVIAEITLDQPLHFLSEGAWELRFPLAAAPRYLGEQSASLANMAIDVASGPLAARASLSMTIGDELAAGRSPESPSHPLQCAQNGRVFEVELGSGNRVLLDRDLVVRWPVARKAPQVELSVARPSATSAHASASTDAPRPAESMFALCTIVPPEPDVKTPIVSRDMTLLIDTSGSMQGEPLAQAKRVACALVESLGNDDTFELFEFSSTTSAFRSKPERAMKAMRVEALSWVNGLVASGGTEMLTGIRAALQDRRPESQRQIVLITDGLVGFERDIVAALITGLPRSARFHALGVGAAANRALLMPIARAGRGVEAMLGIGEDPERASARLLDRMRSPLVVDVTVTGSAVVRTAPDRLPDLFGCSPARIAIELRPEGGEVVVRGRMVDGDYVYRTRIEAVQPGQGSDAVTKLFARERVEDIEARIAGGESKSLLDAEIEQVGLAFGLSTRLTSWVAITNETTVDPRDATRRETMPQALPFAMSAEGLGLRSASAGAAMLPSFLGAQSVTRSAAAPAFASTGKMTSLEEHARSVGLMAGRPAPRPMAPAPASYSAPPMSLGAPSPPPMGGFGGPHQTPLKKAEAEATSGAKDEKADRRDTGASQMQEKAKRGLLSKVVGAVRDVFRRDADDSDEGGSLREEVAKGDGARATRPTRHLRGRIVIARGTEIVVEFEVDEEGIDLSFADLDVSVVLDASTTLAHQRCVVAQSTREGRYEKGQTLRIRITLDAPIQSTLDLVVTFVLANTIEITAIPTA